MNADERARYLYSHPPRCLAEFRAQPVREPEAALDGHAEASSSIEGSGAANAFSPEYTKPTFSISCRCGSSMHTLHGFRWQSDFGGREVVGFISPLSLTCGGCDAQAVLFDANAHGYDAELGYGASTVCGEGVRAIYECEQCGRVPVAIQVNLEYPDDIFDGGLPDFGGREQDLFTWINVIPTCSRCGTTLEVIALECA